ncbi:hypothetical protein [Microbacterium suwonense]|uniref:DUF2975 domain-containing protein n=1 Tax=Microbacterium suwonense TaxID=683047 RepID=A0ABM8FPS7_9MICO|nr:hypothetical protein [Microbacterium suwonense]BDZ37675.1 hypothetical protein GCM10025863_02890 [Microbacterium suwonense]
MSGPVVVLFAVLIVLAVVLVWSIARRRPAALPDRVAPVISAARRRALTAVACAFVVFLAGVVAAVTMPALLGWPLAAAPLVAVAAALLLYASTPARTVPVAAHQPRAAALRYRSWWTVAPRRWLYACLEIVVVFVAIVVFCGMTAQADEQGRSRSIRFESALEASEVSPYPGWFYGVPALIGLIVLMAATVIALHRIAATVALPAPEEADADIQWRRASAAVVVRLVSGAVLFSGGGIALIAGGGVRRAMLESTPTLWAIVGDVLVIVGVVFLVLSVVCVALAALTAFTIGEKISRMPEPVR